MKFIKEPPKKPNQKRPKSILLLHLLAVIILGSGCASQKAAPPRAFNFHADKLAFTNELIWEYEFHPDGTRTTRERVPEPTYAQHCFVMAQTALKFFYHASFDPLLPKGAEATYLKIIREVKGRSSRKVPEQKIHIPGYPNLYEFSREHSDLIKAKAGGAWRSYLQRGHWRMIMPFTRRNQEKTAEALAAKIRKNFAPVVHLSQFPSLTINHAVLLFEVAQSGHDLIFNFYDPNDPSRPGKLTFNRQTREFVLPRSPYFEGGEVDVYEVYRNLLF